MTISREIKTAILVIASILLFIWGYTFLRGRDLLSNYRTFYVLYDNVEGLTPNSPVTINGLVIGKVMAIKFLNNSGKLLVDLQIKTEFPISKTSVAAIYEPGLIGGKQIAILPNFRDNIMAVTGDTLRNDVKPGLTALVGDKLTPISEKLDSVMSNANKLLTSVNNILNEQSQQNVKNTLEGLNKTVANFQQASVTLNEIMATNQPKLNSVISNFDKVSKDFSEVSTSIKDADLGEAAERLKQTLAKVDALVEQLQQGKGTLGKLMKDEVLYNNLTQTSKELEILLQDVRLNPTRYINVSLFGKKNKEYKVPSSDPAENIIIVPVEK